MHKEDRTSGAGEQPVGAEGADSFALTRRQALGRLSVVATAGAAAWVVPEILTASVAGGATLSALPATSAVGGGGSGGGGSGGSGGGGTGVSTSPSTTTGAGGASPATATAHASAPLTTAAGPTLANTGDDAIRDASVAAGLIAGGWALQRWASRTPTRALATPDGDASAAQTDPPGRT